MIPAEVLAAFLAASVLVTLAPGPDNLMVLSLGISRGRAAGIGFGLGCALGCFVHTVLAALGIGALVVASEAAFAALKIAGAAYLLYLGYLSLRHAGKSTLAQIDAAPAEPPTVQLRRGFIANVVNPKVALFFVAFLPQFVAPDRGPVWLQMCLLGGMFAAQTVIIFGSLGWFAGGIGQRLRTLPQLGTWLDRCAACIFIGLAVHLASSSR